MIELFLYVTLSCGDAKELIGRVNSNENISNFLREEIVLTIQDATEASVCSWDAND